MTIKIPLITILFTLMFSSSVLSIQAAKGQLIKQKVGKTAHQCSICNRSFSCASSLKRHGRIHEGIKPYRCPICNKSFRYKGNFTVHQAVHSVERPYRCDTCGKTFKTKRVLEAHQSVHSADKEYACGQCGSFFKQKTNLIKHEKNHKSPHQCNRNGCKVTCASLELLRQHKKTHEGETPFKCDQCGRAFTHENFLERHQQIHTKTYQCDVCGQVLLSGHNLARHKQIHESCQCDECGKHFSKKKYLTSHRKRMHTKKDPKLLPVSADQFSLGTFTNLQDDSEISLPSESFASPPDLLDQSTHVFDDTMQPFLSSVPVFSNSYTDDLLLVDQMPHGR